jgi:prepilin-type N-terminal cleavage/methylation domain-containing protein/prepilin-type processing-associated H-X9-DG protein
MRFMSNYTVLRKPVRGFTLVELLVVISIIALLLSILMPSLTKAREQAKLVTCGAQLKMLGLAHVLYAEDWDGVFTIYRTSVPYIYRSESYGKTHYSGAAILYEQGYAADPKALFCPSTAMPGHRYYGPFDANPENNMWRWCASYGSRPYWRKEGGFYGFPGGWLSNWEYKRNGYAFKKIQNVKRTSESAVLGDLLYDSDTIFHKNAWNVAFVDGHVEAVRPDMQYFVGEIYTHPPYWALGYYNYVWGLLERYAR